VIVSFMIDSGLECLVMLAKYHGFHPDTAQLKHAFALSDKGASVTEILRMNYSSKPGVQEIVEFN